jgi:hypothetical protein
MRGSQSSRVGYRLTSLLERTEPWFEIASELHMGFFLLQGGFLDVGKRIGGIGYVRTSPFPPLRSLFYRSLFRACLPSDINSSALTTGPTLPSYLLPPRSPPPLPNLQSSRDEHHLQPPRFSILLLPHYYDPVHLHCSASQLSLLPPNIFPPSQQQQPIHIHLHLYGPASSRLCPHINLNIFLSCHPLRLPYSLHLSFLSSSIYFLPSFLILSTKQREIQRPSHPGLYRSLRRRRRVSQVHPLPLALVLPDGDRVRTHLLLGLYPRVE